MTTPVKPGDRIRLISMPSDPDPIPVGSTGTVLAVTSGLLAQIQVRWNAPHSHRSLALIPGVDLFEITGHSDLVAEAFACPGCGCRATDLLTWDQHFEKVTCDLCGTTYEP